MDRIIEILKTLDRPGIDHVLEFMEENNSKGSRCYGHHKYAGGLVDVLSFMTLARQQRADNRWKIMKEGLSESLINVVLLSQIRKGMPS